MRVEPRDVSTMRDARSSDTARTALPPNFPLHLLARRGRVGSSVRVILQAGVGGGQPLITGAEDLSGFETSDTQNARRFREGAKSTRALKDRPEP